MADPVTPRAGTNSFVAAANTPVVVFDANPNGGAITNPYTAADQGLDPSAQPEPLYVDVVGDPTLLANGTTFALWPGQTWTAIPGQTTVTKVNAATAGHKFSAYQF